MVVKAVNVDMAPLSVNLYYKLCEFLQVHFPDQHRRDSKLIRKATWKVFSLRSQLTLQNISLRAEGRGTVPLQFFVWWHSWAWRPKQYLDDINSEIQMTTHCLWGKSKFHKCLNFICMTCNNLFIPYPHALSTVNYFLIFQHAFQEEAIPYLSVFKFTLFSQTSVLRWTHLICQ